MKPPEKGSLTDFAHDEVLQVINRLMVGDPAMDTPQGLLLAMLAQAIEVYESAIYPELTAPPPESEGDRMVQLEPTTPADLERLAGKIALTAKAIQRIRGCSEKEALERAMKALEPYEPPAGP